jgi:hypothetical protein
VSEELPCHTWRKYLYKELFPHIKKLMEQQKDLEKRQDKLEFAMKKFKRRRGRDMGDNL